MNTIFEKLENLNVSEATLIDILESITNKIQAQAAESSLPNRKEKLNKAVQNFAQVLGKLPKNSPEYKKAEKQLNVAQKRVEHATNVSQSEPKKQGYTFSPSAFK